MKAAKPVPETVEEYIQRQPERVRAALQRVRAAIRKAIPEAEEGISYKMPVFKLNGSNALFFAGWKDHYSVYAASKTLVEALGPQLEAYEVEKGTIRFPVSEPVPAKLIERIAKVRAAHILQRKPRARPGRT